MRFRFAPALLLAAAVACAHGSSTVTRTAEDDYAAGIEDARSHNYPEAVKQLERVRNKYPFTKYAALAELALADIKFDQDKFTEAAEAYKAFVKLHPTHERSDYAAYRAGLSYWNDGPSEFFIFPPPYEKEQASAREAVRALEDFGRKYPESTYRAEAEKVLAAAKARLQEHEWYVAGFYAKREHWAGAAGRLEGILRDYPGSPREAEALLSLAQAYLKLDERYRAQEALQQLIVKHPEDPRRAEAEKLLASLR